MRQCAIFWIGSSQFPNKTTNQSLCGVIKELCASRGAGFTLFQKVFNKNTRNFIYTFFIFKVSRSNGIYPMYYFIERNHIKWNIRILKKWIRHFSNLEILVVVDYPTKRMFFEMFQKTINHAFCFSTTCSSNYRSTSSYILYFEITSIQFKMDFIFGTGFRGVLLFLKKDIEDSVYQ